jgi:penicillin V acylase-like amidase (Ntn superfamily)
MDDTVYYPVTGRSIAISDICSYILSTCSNVNEAINILSNIDTYGSVIPVINRLLGLHIVVHDAYGISIVCQLTDKRNIYYRWPDIPRAKPVQFRRKARY